MRPLLLALALVSCKNPPAEDSDTPPEDPPEWDPGPEEAPCGAEAEAPLRDEVLADAGLEFEDLGFSQEEIDRAPYADYLDDRFLLPWFRDLQAKAATVPCFAGDAVRSNDHFAALGRPASGALRTAMGLLEEPIPERPQDPADFPDLAYGLDALLEATGDGGTSWEAPALPDGLGEALGPVLGAMAEVVAAWEVMAAAAPEPAADLAKEGHGGAVLDYETRPDLADAEVQEWVVGAEGPRVLYGPTLRLLHALEDAALERFADQGDDGTLLAIETSAGWIRIDGPGADSPEDPGAVLFWLDLGGDDVYAHQAGGNADGMPLSVMVDLGGADTYGYAEEPSSRDGDRLPSDADGRYSGDTAYGPFSLSRTGRQGAGRFGVGVLFDLGGGGDTYRSLRMSQGWGHLGIGLLLDDGGDDAFAIEEGGQGGGSMGIGLLLDRGGSDTYRTYVDSQGFAYVQGVGILQDEGDGADVYFANPGDPAIGGDPMYYSPQMPGQANSSFVQGAGFGRRGDTDGGFLSGGVGLLSDGGGDDAYTAGLFAQGAGYWQGLGVLADRDGNDTYDAFWYVQGASAHYAIGVVLEGGGDDQVNPNLQPRHVHLGSGHDYSIGVWIDASGDDVYDSISLAVGASNCQGIGLFADNDGSDTYRAGSVLSMGLGNESSECDSGYRSTIHSVGLFLDSGGDADVYEWPSTDGVPSDDASFGHTGSGDEDEHGGAVDGDGETGFYGPW